MAMRASRGLIDWTIGARIERGAEIPGQDIVELGIEAFPEFLPQPEEHIPLEAAPGKRSRRKARAPRPVVGDATGATGACRFRW